MTLSKQILVGLAAGAAVGLFLGKKGVVRTAERTQRRNAMIRIIGRILLVGGLATAWRTVAAGALLLGGFAAPVAAEAPDKAIRQAFEDVLRREPSDRELRRYRDLMNDEHWTERDVRDDLRRRSDYQRNSQRKFQDPDRLVRRAYQDILDREPDAEGLRLYRSRMVDQDWTEQDVREALRKSPEYARHSVESADRIVGRAYGDVLGREPDSNGLRIYRDKVLNQGWDEYDVNAALRKSPEYRQKGLGTNAGATAQSGKSKSTTTRAQAEDVVRRAYQSVLGRDPDPGSQGYVDHVLRDHWTEADVARELRKSAEYRSKPR